MQKPITVKSVEDYGQVIDHLDKDIEQIKNNGSIDEKEFAIYEQGFNDCISIVTDRLFNHFLG